MSIYRLLIASLIAIAVGTFAIFAWNSHSNEWAAEDKFVPPPFPTASEKGRPVLVSSGPLASTHRSAKPIVAADHEGQVVVIAQNLIGSRDSSIVQWRSVDAGQSWEASRILDTWPNDATFFGDPWITTDRRGRFYYLYIPIRDMAAVSPSIFHRSSDAGENWSPPIKLAQGGDRPVLGVSPNGKRLVVAASMSQKITNGPTAPLHGKDPQLAQKIEASMRFYSGVFVSTDRGRRWQQISGPLANTHAVPFSVVVDDDGRIANSWVAKGDGSRSVVCATDDDGQTWTETELVASLQPDRSHPFNGERFPVLALDGNRILHVAFISEKAQGLFVRTSKNWIDWESPIQLSGNDSDEVRMPAVAAWGPTVHVTWMERRGTHWQTFYCGSPDHGQTWSARIRLSVPHASSTLIDNNGFQITSDDDQSSLNDDGLGNVHAVWAVKGREAKTLGTVWHAVVRWQRDDERSEHGRVAR